MRKNRSMRLLIRLVSRSWKSCHLLLYFVSLPDTLRWLKYSILCYSCFSVSLFSIRDANGKSQALTSSTGVFLLPDFHLGDLDVDFRQSKYSWRCFSS